MNLYAHGNIMNGNNTHFSNEGWGPWEVNLSKVVNLPITPAATKAQPTYGTEWTKLFQNSPIARYGPLPTDQPDNTVFSPLSYWDKSLKPNIVIPPYYSRIDFGGLTGA